MTQSAGVTPGNALIASVKNSLDGLPMRVDFTSVENSNAEINAPIRTRIHIRKLIDISGL